MSSNKQTASTKINIVKLSPDQPAKALDESCEKTETGCGTEQQFEDIIYVPMLKQFWLIPKQAADELEEAAVTLFNNGKRIAKSSPEDKVALMEALDLSHLMKFFYSPHPSTFLGEEDYARYQELKALNEEADSQIKSEFDPVKPPEGSETAQRYPGYTYIYIRYITQKELIKLDQIGKQAAEDAGYEVDEKGEIFTPEQIRLRDMLLNYAKNAAVIAENEKLTGEMKDVFTEINRLRAIYQFYEKQLQIPDADMVMSFFKNKYQSLSQMLKEQVEIILQLGAIGIAVPELAFGYHDSDGLEGEQLVNRGINRVYEMRRKQAERSEVVDDISDLFADWQFFLGNIGASVPTGPFVEKLLELIDRDNELERYIEDAEKVCASFVPNKLLVWDPLAYQYQGNSELLNAPMPMREFTKPSGIKKIDMDGKAKVKELYQFSIKDLAAKTTRLAFAAKSLDYWTKPKKVKTSFKNLNNNHDELLELYLEESGAVKVKLKDDENWYDEDKQFDPNKLYDKVKNYRIKSLEKDEDKEAWGALLKHLIFEDDFFKRVMGFDPGYGAQLVRLLSKYSQGYLPFMEYAATASVKKPALPSLSLGGFDAKLVASPYHGKVTLIEPFYLPKPANAYNPVFTFKHHTTREPINIDFGHFIFRARLEAWGFAGASLALSAQASLYASQGRFGLMVSGPAEQAPSSQDKQLKPSAAKGVMVNAGGELFVGVQSGINGTVEIK